MPWRQPYRVQKIACSIVSGVGIVVGVEAIDSTLFGFHKPLDYFKL